MLRDATATKAVRQRRAQALHALGRIFESAKAPDGGAAGVQGVEDAKQAFEDAVLKTMEKRMREQDAEHD